ncbi:hypothetical protein EUX98_g1232 [Antrodiella citrinella]|uniref:DNA 3'-5' helicase n=1 Tax=Antrodiella citrinella TaxID=2447956 RepID=A0A4S4N4Z3_9APHY|nr:hypothetical protein EUX98_g1232 [Antrodiella citrinella]
MAKSTTGTDVPSIADIRKRTEEVFGRRPCLWQVEVAQAMLRREKDVVCVSGTGTGKTLTFWMPILFNPGIQIVITPLNVLGAQNTKQLERIGVRAIAISAETATEKNFQDIKDGKYRVVTTNPEEALKKKGRFEKLWNDPVFTGKLISVISSSSIGESLLGNGAVARLFSSPPDSMQWMRDQRRGALDVIWTAISSMRKSEICSA